MDDLQDDIRRLTIRGNDMRSRIFFKLILKFLVTNASNELNDLRSSGSNMASLLRDSNLPNQTDNSLLGLGSILEDTLCLLGNNRTLNFALKVCLRIHIRSWNQ